jgi:hypothetical protein
MYPDQTAKEAQAHTQSNVYESAQDQAVWTQNLKSSR